MKFWALAFSFAATTVSASVGPDIRVTDVYEAVRWGAVGGVSAYSLGTIACNIGDAPAAWNRDTDQHPVIAQNLFRLKGGRFEQIGLSWVKHTFAADIVPLCGPCQVPADFRTQLGVGCGDAYSAFINGSVFYLGPRSQVNAFTGAFTFPVDSTGFPPAAPTVGRRIQVQTNAISTALNAGARYFGQAQYVSPDEAASGNGENSLTTREVFVSESLAITTQAAAPPFVGLSALETWGQVDPAVSVARVRVPGEGVLVVASRVTALGSGQWRYNYAIENINSDRAARSLAVPLDACSPEPAVWAAQPEYHSGEPFDIAPWASVRAGGIVEWSCAHFADNPNANAIRWGTVSAFELIASRPPRAGTVVIGLYKSGSPNQVISDAVVPGANPDFNLDGFIDGFDYDDFVSAFEIGLSEADFNADGFPDGFDYDDFVTSFESGC